MGTITSQLMKHRIPVVTTIMGGGGGGGRGREGFPEVNGNLTISMCTLITCLSVVSGLMKF